MTRKEKELKILEALGLKVGDNIKIVNSIYEIIEETDGVKLETKDYRSGKYLIHILVSQDWEKVELLKDKKCKDFERCSECPLQNYYCGSLFGGELEKHTLGEIYNEVKKDLDKAKQEIFGEEK